MTDVKWDNPTSRNHYRYQRMVNRVFVVFAVILYTIAPMVLEGDPWYYGLLFTLFTAVVAVLGLLIWSMLLATLWMGTLTARFFIHWLGGH